MRLSEAILLGSTSLKAKIGGSTCLADPAGCALDMALLAIGETGGWERVKEYWPWLKGQNEFGDTLALRIATHFDTGMLNPAFSLEKFAAWVDSIDPTPRCEPPVQEPSQVEVRQEKVTDLRQESTVSHD